MRARFCRGAGSIDFLFFFLLIKELNPRENLIHTTIRSDTYTSPPHKHTHTNTHRNQAMVCPVPLSWEEVAGLIDEGTVESLGKMGRSEDDLKVYRKFMDGVRARYL